MSAYMVDREHIVYLVKASISSQLSLYDGESHKGFGLPYRQSHLILLAFVVKYSVHQRTKQSKYFVTILLRPLDF